jgi:hypothetical protein
MNRYFCALLLGSALLAPVGLRADDHDRDHRYYDAYTRDYHNWDDREDRAYRHWLEEQHRAYRDYAHASKKDQKEYWKWRHKHMDWDDRH